MANKIIASISINMIKNAINGINNKTVEDYIWSIVCNIMDYYPEVRISSSLRDEYKVKNAIYPLNDNIILYYDQGPICLGKWASSTIMNTESYNADCHCLNDIHLLNKLNTYYHENRLQKTRNSLRKAR